MEGTGATASRELGQGWNVSPRINIAVSETVRLTASDGPGAIPPNWLTVHPTWWRRLVFIHWDDEETPFLETRLGDCSANGWSERCDISSIPITLNPAGGQPGLPPVVSNGAFCRSLLA